MYIVMNFVRFVLKNMRLSKDFWNFIDENVVYVKNRIIITNDDNNKIITSFETINEKIFNVFNFQTLSCKTYIHVFKIIKRYKFDDRSWKNIFVNYVNNNQWKIYNSRIRKIYIIKNVRFDENYSYYDQNHRVFSNLHKHNDEFEINEFWHSKNDVWFDFRLEKSFDFSEEISSSEKTFSEKIVFVSAQISMTSKFLSSRDDDSNANESNAKNAKFEKKKFSKFRKIMIIQTIRIRFLSMNFKIFYYLMILFLKFQFFFRVSLQNENTIFKIREKLNENELTNDTFIQSISLTSTRKKRNKTFSSSFSNRDSRLKIDAIC